MLGLVESRDSPLIRTDKRSGSYHNYLYIKNSADTLFEDNISLIFYNENNNYIGAKVFNDVSVPPNSTQLLMENKDTMSADEWNQYTYRTKQETVTFDVW